MLKLFVTLQTLIAARLDRRDDEGATAVEYGLMVSLIAVVIITAVAFIGTELDAVFDLVGAAIR
jgi:pilus assembly protein Flp/PilA